MKFRAMGRILLNAPRCGHIFLLAWRCPAAGQCQAVPGLDVEHRILGASPGSPGVAQTARLLTSTLNHCEIINNYKGIIMRLVISRSLALLVMLGFCGSVLADETVRLVWLCTINDEKTMDDVREANVAWVEFMHENVDDSITSTILTPIIGSFEGRRFVFADDFPSMAVWNESRAAEDTEEGEAVNEALTEAATCDSNSMYSAEES
jgi:hypothetical protein